MTDYPSWQYDEFKQIGVDYNDPDQVEIYEARHSQFRDIEADSQAILDALTISPQHILIDIGAGTGTLAILAARRCSRVFAVDVSQLMLDYTSGKASAAGISNIVFCHGGFLTYEHRGEPADAIVTSTAFHHLPDFWKGIALHRMNSMLKPGGQLYIKDVVFSEIDPLSNIAKWIDELAAIGGESLRKEIETHIREEFSTFDWIMDGLLVRAGFRIQDKEIQEGVMARYLCVKETGDENK